MDPSPAKGRVFNEEFDVSEVPADVRATFLRGEIEKRCLPAGWELYRISTRPLVESGGHVGETWKSVAPILPGEAHTPIRAARPGERIVRVRLARAVWAFVGRAAGPLADAPGLEGAHGGGAQIWIPNLTRAEIVPIAP